MNIYAISKGYKIVGIYQIMCASWGLHLLFTNFTFLSLLLLLPFLTLLAYAGMELILQKDEGPYRLTIINQALQVVQFQSGGYGFLYSGLHFKR